jgi:DNA-directed RNA polymerase alpha subunit
MASLTASNVTEEDMDESPQSHFPMLPQPAFRALVAAKIRCLADLSQRTEKELKKLPGIGPKSLELLRLALHADGLSFKARPEKNLEHVRK